jgi:hypothetical protein
MKQTKETKERRYYKYSLMTGQLLDRHISISEDAFKKLSFEEQNKYVSISSQIIPSRPDSKGNGDKVAVPPNAKKIGTKSVERHPNSSKVLGEPKIWKVEDILNHKDKLWESVLMSTSQGERQLNESKFTIFLNKELLSDYQSLKSDRDSLAKSVNELHKVTNEYVIEISGLKSELEKCKEENIILRKKVNNSGLDNREFGDGCR